jgi:hypothetical protein
LSSISAPRTKFGRECAGDVDLIPGATGSTSQNPYVGMNLGLIEIQRSGDGDVSTLKFKLIGSHPTEDRAVTYFESPYLT